MVEIVPQYFNNIPLVTFSTFFIEYDKAISENPPTSHPNHVQQQWMKELLFMTAETKSPSINESLISEIGSVSFDRRLDNSSVINSPRSMTPVHRVDCLDDGEPVRTKRMRFQVCLVYQKNSGLTWF